MKKKIASLALAGCLVVPAAAFGHVTLQPEEVPAGSFARLDVRVPNELDDAATEKVEVEMPDGFVFVSYEPVDGWTGEVKFEKLDDPIEEHGEEITEQASTVTFTADSPADAIQPGQFRDFGISVGLPSDAAAGEELVFPSIQTYDNGDVVRWIGEPDSEEPAPVVTLTEGEEDEHAAEEEAEGAEESADDARAEANEAADEVDDDNGSDGLAIAALIVGGLGLVTGGAALMRGRRNG